jgi:hypothetical protein
MVLEKLCAILEIPPIHGNAVKEMRFGVGNNQSKG